MMTNERQMAEAIFDLFRKNKCGTGQMVLMNVVRTSLIFNFNPKEKELFNTVFVGLVNTGYIEYVVTSPERMVLTQKGCNYIYDPNLQSKMFRTPWVIPNPDKTDWTKAYNRLWRIIGPTEGAICYIKGSDFYNQVTKYNEELPPTYSAYIAELRERDLSTNRADYYKALIESIGDGENRMRLYIDLQQLIEGKIVYSEASEFEDLFTLPNVVGENCASQYPLELPKPTEQNVMDVVMRICQHYKHLIEVRRLSSILYNGDVPQDEDFVQKYFYSIALSYCEYSNIDLNRESDVGCGRLDFKFSSGAHKKVIIEVKLSSNSQLIHGLTTQLPWYMEAEGTKDGIYMVMRMSPDDDKEINRLQEVHANMPDDDKKPQLLIIDAVPRPSASKA